MWGVVLMGRFLDWLVPGLVFAVIVSLVILAGRPKQMVSKPDPNPVTRSEVDELRRRIESLELARWKTDQEVLAIKADVAALSGRVAMIEHVVPVQAIRDRANQK